jgi:Zn-dependent protease with chaperone function
LSLTSKTHWTGYYYDGRTADRQAVTVTLAAGGLRVERTDGISIVWPIGDLRQTQGAFSSEHLRIEYGVAPDPVQAVFVEQPGLAEAVRAAYPYARSSWQGRRTGLRLLAIGIAGILIATGIYIWGAPLAADWIAPQVPVAWEASLSHSAAERLAPPSRQCGTAESMADLRSILDRLLAARPDAAAFNFRMVVVRDTIVNAFAAPGGFIAIHSGLLKAARTPEEFAGVLSHEISHVTKRHSVRAIVREMPLRLALALATGGTSAETPAAFVGSLGALRYRRSDEAEADREGMQLLNDARVDPTGVVSFMRTLETKDARTPRFVSYLSSHPHTPDRVAALEALAKQSRYDAKPLLDAAAWNRARSMCD